VGDPKDELKAMEAALKALEPLDSEQRIRAVTWLQQALGVNGVAPSAQVGSATPSAAPAPPAPNASQTAGPAETQLTPKEFLALKNPQTDVERLTVLAYYLSKNRDMASFKTAELEDLNKEAAGRRFSNAPNTAKNAVKKNYLTAAGGRERQITHLGEKVVEAMPDRDAVEAALDAVPKPRKRSVKRKKEKTKKEG
jgi:hypothetical protein